MRSLWIRLLTVVPITLIAAAGGFMLLENRLIFHPTQLPPGWTFAGSGFRLEGMTADDRFFRAADGVRLHGLYCRALDAPDDPERKVLLWLHGNAGCITDRLVSVVGLRALPADIFIVDYRGFGASEGKPSEKGLYRDSRAAWDHLTVDRRIAPSRIVLFGKSLGGAVAVDLATRVSPAGLIVQSSITSIADMEALDMPLVPRFLIRTKMNSLAKVGSIACPKLFIHGPDDEVVPFAMGRRLFEAAGEPKSFYEVPGAGHDETWLVGGEAYRKRLEEFILSL